MQGMLDETYPLIIFNVAFNKHEEALKLNSKLHIIKVYKNCLLLNVKELFLPKVVL